MLADRLEHVLHRDLLAAEIAGKDRAAIDEDRRHVEADHRHHHARQGLVAAGETDQRIVSMAPHVNSTESAMHSRDGSDERMPSWPMAMPSVTVMVQNSRGVPPAEATPFLTAWAWRISEILQGAASFQHDATPTKG